MRTAPGQAEQIGRLLHGPSREKAKLDQFTRLRLGDRQPVQGSVEGQ